MVVTLIQGNLRLDLSRPGILQGYLDVLVDKAFWGGLFPTSIVGISSTTFYIGMRQGVAKIEFQNQSPGIVWLTPP